MSTSNSAAAAKKMFGAHLIEAGAQPLPGAYAPMVSAIIDDLVLFAVAHATGRKSARELHARVNPQRALVADQRRD